MWKYAIMAGVLLWSTPSADAKQTQATGEGEQGPSLADLVSLIDSQKALIESQGKRIDALEGRLRKVENLVLASDHRLQEQKGQAPQEMTPSAVADRLAQREKSVQGLAELPTSVVEAGEFPGSFRIPGTDAALKIGGQVQMTVVKTLGPLGVDDRFVTSSIPIEGTQEAGKGSRLVYTTRPSRLNFDLRTPTGVGSMRLFLEADYAGGDIDAFRLRHAYGQWGHFLAGQTWSTFSDPEAVPNGIDFEGLNAISLFRQPQIRYTRGWGEKRSFSIAAENPSPDVTGASGVNQVPDIVARLRFESGEASHLPILRRGGHLQIAVIGRQIRAEIPDHVNETVSNGAPAPLPAASSTCLGGKRTTTSHSPPTEAGASAATLPTSGPTAARTPSIIPGASPSRRCASVRLTWVSSTGGTSTEESARPLPTGSRECRISISSRTMRFRLPIAGRSTSPGLPSSGSTSLPSTSSATGRTRTESWVGRTSSRSEERSDSSLRAVISATGSYVFPPFRQVVAFARARRPGRRRA